MPNWVYNGLTIEGNPESVNKLINQVGQPFVDNVEAFGDLSFGNTRELKYSNPIFSFRNIIAPTDLEAYKEQPVRSELDVNDPKWWEDTRNLSEVDNSWYNWNLRNWGVKWDVAISDENKYPDTEMAESDNGDNKVVYYNFNTAWGVAEQALTNLSSQYPDLLFTLSYEEETGWGGELEILKGEIISQSEYGWQCRECDHTEEETPYCDTCEFDMCPSCGWGEPTDEDRANCQTHAVQSEA